jgi:hypothetical protein
VHALGELLCFREVGRRRLAPEEICVRRVLKRPRDRALDAALVAEEPFRRAIAGEELAIARIDVARDELRAVGVGARDEHGRHVENVRRQRAATSVRMKCEVGTSTLPPRCPHFFSDESWSSK